jgi:hypothetical protein
MEAKADFVWLIPTVPLLPIVESNTPSGVKAPVSFLRLLRRD